MKAKALPKADAILDPELRELCDHLDARARVKTAKKFQRWADHLTKSAMQLEPGIVPLIPPPKVPRGFFLVNISRREQEELRALARANHMPLRSAMKFAVLQEKRDLQERLRVAKLAGVSPHRCWELIDGNPRN